MAYTIETVTGTIEKVKSDGKGFLLDNGNWYNNKFNDLPTDLAAGKTVVFKTKGPFWQSFDEIGGTASEGTTSAPKAPTRSFGSNQRVFPVPLQDGSRSIIRQNSLTHASGIIGACLANSKLPMTKELLGFDPAGMSVPEIVVKVARTFEMYSAGDVERMRAEGTLTDDFDL